jgi:hypothetical protein
MPKYVYPGDAEMLADALKAAGCAPAVKSEIQHFAAYKRLTVLVSQAGTADDAAHVQGILRAAEREMRTVEAASYAAASVLQHACEALGFTLSPKGEIVPADPPEPAPAPPTEQ